MEYINVEILNGLPGSGKSYYAVKRKQELAASGKYSKDGVVILDLDKKYSSFAMELNHAEYVIADGLFLTNDAICKFIQKLESYKRSYFEFRYTIVHWNEDRDACLHNDFNRRTTDSEATIRSAVFEAPDPEYIFKETGINVSVKEMKVIRKPDVFNKIDKTLDSQIEGDFLYSDDWVIGGTTRGYDYDYNTVYDSVSVDERPMFEELYDFLEKVCPSLDIVHFRKLYKSFVKTETFEENDYYSSLIKQRYMCNLKDVLKYLEDLHLLDSTTGAD